MTPLKSKAERDEFDSAITVITEKLETNLSKRGNLLATLIVFLTAICCKRLLRVIMVNFFKLKQAYSAV